MRPAAPTRSILAGGAVALFFLSFLMSGSSNAIPQVFLQLHAPADKAQLLSVALVLATLAAAGGVLASRRLALGRAQVLALAVAVAVLVQGLLAAGSVPWFIALLALLEFAVNLLVDQADRGAVARAGVLHAFNDTAGTSARLAGMLAAPAFFTVFAHTPSVLHGGVALLSLAAAAGCWCVFGLPAQAPQAMPATPQAQGSARGQDRLVFGYAVAVYAGMYLLAANAIFLLQDLFRMDGAEARGGALIVAVFAAAIVANGLAGRLAPREAPRALALAAPAVGLALAACVPLAGLRPGYGACLAAAAAIGIGYGFFLAEVRRQASRAARAGRTEVLGWFNNMGNASALLAFALMLVLSRAAGGQYYAWLMVAVLALQVTGAVLLAGVVLRRS